MKYNKKILICYWKGFGMNANYGKTEPLLRVSGAAIPF